MRIKLIRFPYREYEIGEIVDLGEEKNKSMISLGRAVLYDEGELKKAVKEKKKPKVEEADENAAKEEVAEVAPKKKKKKKKKVSENDEQSLDKKSFWDKMK